MMRGWAGQCVGVGVCVCVREREKDSATMAGITQLPNNMLTSAVIGREIFKRSYKLLTRTHELWLQRCNHAWCPFTSSDAWAFIGILQLTLTRSCLWFQLSAVEDWLLQPFGTAQLQKVQHHHFDLRMCRFSSREILTSGPDLSYFNRPLI